MMRVALSRVIPAKAGTHEHHRHRNWRGRRSWAPAFAGVTMMGSMLAACQSGAPTNNQSAAAAANAAAPADPLAVAERLVRERVSQRGEVRFVEARVRDHQGVPVVCGTYEQAGARQRYIVVDGQVWVEPEMGPNQMPQAINEFCAEGGRA